MSQISVYVDTSEVLDELSDKELLREVEERGLTAKLDLDGARREDLMITLDRKDYAEVDYLLRTYFLRRPPSRSVYQTEKRDPATGRPVIQ